MTGLDLRVQNFLKFFLAFLGASTDDLGLCRPSRYSVICSKQEPTGGDPSLGTSRYVSTQRGTFP
jgi:hypothetical protein